jgi:hypothetical protein
MFCGKSFSLRFRKLEIEKNGLVTCTCGSRPSCLFSSSAVCGDFLAGAQAQERERGGGCTGTCIILSRKMAFQRCTYRDDGAAKAVEADTRAASQMRGMWAGRSIDPVTKRAIISCFS